MPLLKEAKKEVIQKYQLHKTDTGSPEIQIAMLTQKINDLSKHLTEHKKDHASRRGLLMMVSTRASLLKYLKKTDLDRYNSIIKKLNLRK